MVTLVCFASVFFAMFYAGQAFSAPLIAFNGGKRQMVTSDGRASNSLKFDSICYLQNGLFWGTTNECEPFSAQLLSPQGTPISEAKYLLFEDVAISAVPFPFACGAILVKKRGRDPNTIESELLYPDGKIVNLGLLPFDAYSYSNYVTMAISDGRYTIYDVDNRKSHANIVGDALYYSGTSAIIIEEHGGKKLRRIDGTMLTPVAYDDVLLCQDSEEAIWLEINNRRMLFDVARGETMPIKVDAGWRSWPNGDMGRNVKVLRDGKWGVYNLEEKNYSIQPKYDKISWATRNAIVGLSGGISELSLLHDGRILVKTHGTIQRTLETTSNGCELWEIKEKDGIVATVFITNDDVYIFKGKSIKGVLSFKQNPSRCELQFLIVKDVENGLIGAMSIDGKSLLYPMKPLTSERVDSWGSKVLVSEVQTSYKSVVNLSGNTLIEYSRHASSLDELDSSGYARIVCDGKAGLVDGDCNFVLPCQYEDVGHFGEGLVPAKQGGKWGFVELSGKWAIPARFEEARSFKDGYAPVCVGGKWGFIGKSGKVATPFEYEDVKDVREGHFRAKVNGKWGIFALDGRCTLPAEYDAILAEGEYGYGDP